MYLVSALIHYFNISSTYSCPSKTNAPLIIDADAVLPVAVALQYFDAIARRHP